MHMEFNLLPWRQEKRQKKVRNNMAILFLSALLGVVLSGGYYFYLHMKQLDAKEAIEIIEAKNTELKPQLVEKAGLEKTINLISTKIKTIIALQENRTSVLHMLEELSLANDQSLFIVSLGLNNTKEFDEAEITGVAKDDSHIADLMIKLNESKWFLNPEIIKISKSDQSEKLFNEETKTFEIKTKLHFVGERIKIEK